MLRYNKITMSEKLEPKADKLIFNVSSQEKNFCDSFVYEPINAAEERLGSAYMLGELKDVSEESFFILNHIATLFKRNYYSNTGKQPLSAFEDALKRVNEGMHDLAADKKTEWIGKLHFAIGVLSHDIFYFTACGTPRIFIARHGEATDLGEKISNALRETTSQKTFKNIASGKVEKNDKVFMLTAETFQAIPRDLWKEIAASHFPAKKIREANSSQRINLSHTGGFLILSLSGSEVFEEKDATSPASTSNRQESLFREKLDKIPVFRRNGQGVAARRQATNSFLSTLKIILKFIYVILRYLIKSLIFILGKLLMLIGKFLAIIWTQMKKIKFFQALDEKIKSVPSWSFFQISGKIISLFRKKFVYIPLIIILIGLCGFAGFYYQKREVKVSEWRKVLTQAQEKYKEGEISLIYGAKEKAITSFNETNSLASKLESSGFFKKETKELKESTLAKLQKLLNVVIIDKPEVLTTLGNFSIRFNSQHIAIASDSSLLFSSDPSSALFYKFNIQAKKGEFSLAPIPEGGVSKADRLKEFTLFFASPKSVFFYLPKEQHFNDSQTIIFPYDDFSFSDMITYKNNIFFLDSKNNEIIKFVTNNPEDQIKAGTLWLKKNTKKPVNAKSIACDGNMWVLSGDGTIQKYINGVFIQDLKTNASFGNPVKIWTSQESPAIYVLDSKNKNLTLLDKKGQVAEQFFSEKFNDLKDFWVSDDEKTIYVLNGNQILLIKNEE